MAKKRPPELMLIDTQGPLDELAARCRAEGRFAFDTEFVMEDRFEPDICLLQIATGDAVAVVDPMSGVDLSPIWALVYDADIETVVHAGQEDFALCFQHTGRVPRKAFDVQIAAGLVGWDYPLSLQKLVQQAVRVRLHKANTLTDWRKRPLTEGQMRYAADDVAYLLAVHQKICDRLQRLNRLDWAQAEFARFEESGLYRRAEEEKLRRVKGTGSLKGRQLAVLHEVLAWRDVLAESLDRPPRVVLKDYLAVEIARTGIASFQEIRGLRGINLSDKNVRDLAKTVTAALELPQERWPVPETRDVESPREAALVALLTGMIRSHCLDHDLAYSLVATKRSIHHLIRHRLDGRPADPEEVELLNGWRKETVGRMADELLAGKRSLRIAAHHGETMVVVDGEYPEK